jgi:hypothetical protein
MGMGGNDFFESMMSDLLNANDRVTQAKLKALEERNAQLESQSGPSYEEVEDDEGLYDQVAVAHAEYTNESEGGFIDYAEPDQSVAEDYYDALTVPQDEIYGDPNQSQDQGQDGSQASEQDADEGDQDE